MDSQNEPQYFKRLEEVGITLHEFNKPAFKYTTLTTAEKILENLKVRFRTPASFNDPLEFSKDMFDYSCNMKLYKEKIVRSYEVYNRVKLNKKQQKRLLASSSKEEFIEICKNYVEGARHKSLVFCMSRDYDNSAMWSHYAQYHTGVVLGLYFLPYSEINNGESLVTLCTTYVDTMMRFPIFSAFDDDESIALYYWIFAKSKVWAYENEIRCFIDNTTNIFPLKEDSVTPYSTGKYFDLGLSSKQFCEIYYGVNTPKNEIEKLENIIDNKGLEINSYQMKIEEGTFDIRKHLLKQRRTKL